MSLQWPDTRRAVFARSLGCDDDSSGGEGAPDAGLSDTDAGGNCAAGTQDENGDGQCNPNCASTACDNGTCDIDTDGLALCSCDEGYAGASCDELIMPDASSMAFWVDAADSTSVTLHPGGSGIATWTDKGTGAIDTGEVVCCFSIGCVITPIVIQVRTGGPTRISN